MGKQLIFVHGRSQEDKDPTALKEEWIKAFESGLKKNSLKMPIKDSDIKFPYYGDTLRDLVQNKPTSEIAHVIVKGKQDIEDKEYMAFLASVAIEIKEKKGISTEQLNEFNEENLIQHGIQNWGFVRAILKAIDKYVPFGSSAFIAAFTWDVYHYLQTPDVSDEIEEAISKVITTAPTVVVGHSLGSIVSYNLLRREAGTLGWNVPLFMTLGSPLGIKAIRNSLTTRKRPDCLGSVGEWFNAHDPDDVVSLYPLERAVGWNLTPAIINYDRVDNQTENQHGISGYLSDPIVAERLYKALI
jgi:hypothetical protein